jgi:hypothetical protein
MVIPLIASIYSFHLEICLKLAQKVCTSIVKYQNLIATDAKMVSKHALEMHSSPHILLCILKPLMMPPPPPYHHPMMKHGEREKINVTQMSALNTAKIWFADLLQKKLKGKAEQASALIYFTYA